MDNFTCSYSLFISRCLYISEVNLLKYLNLLESTKEKCNNTVCDSYVCMVSQSKHVQNGIPTKLGSYHNVNCVSIAAYMTVKQTQSL